MFSVMVQGSRVCLVFELNELGCVEGFYRQLGSGVLVAWNLILVWQAPFGGNKMMWICFITFLRKVIR